VWYIRAPGTLPAWQPPRQALPGDSKLMSQARVIAVVAVVAAAAVIVMATSRQPAMEPRVATLLTQPALIAEFELTDQHGRTLTRDVFKGRWSVLFAGFTHCPDACPATLGLLRALNADLSDDGKAMQTVFLSVDPERDSPEQLAAYLGYFETPIVGMTGATAQIDRLSDSLGIAYVKIPGAAEQYTVDHSTALVLIDPQARLAGYVTPPLDLDDLAADVRMLLTRNR
jgi:protein SCO1